MKTLFRKVNGAIEKVTVENAKAAKMIRRGWLDIDPAKAEAPAEDKPAKRGRPAKAKAE